MRIKPQQLFLVSKTRQDGDIVCICTWLQDAGLLLCIMIQITPKAGLYPNEPMFSMVKDH